MSSIDDAQLRAMFDFFGCFLSITVQIEDISDLSDGVALFEALSEISPDHFDPTTIGRGLGDNWALKTSNLRKLLRNLEEFYHDELERDADFESISALIPAIAKESDPGGIMSLFELLAAAAVTCEDKNVFVERIMEMSPESARELQAILQDVLARITTFDAADAGDEDDDADSLVFEGEDGHGASIASPAVLFSSHMDDSMDRQNSATNGLLKERDELRHALQDARRELASIKSQAALLAEDNESEQKKLRALAEDLQTRLGRVQDELMNAEQDLLKKNRALEETQTKVTDLEEKNASLVDELDVANSKASQLRKAEATVVAYRKKLEGMGAMNQQMTDLEDQTASYLRQIMELESEVKKVAVLQKTVEELQNQSKRDQSSKSEAEESLKAKEVELDKLRNIVSAAEKAKKLYQDELNELRAQHEGAGHIDDVTSPMTGLSLTSSKSASEAREHSMRLEIENSKLKAQIEQMQAQNAGELQDKISLLEGQVSKKEAEVAKLINDKEKLEAYTKKTLQKFQEKYLVALQDCKAKLKEKHDKIETLEMRSANEKVAQKREERLLSSAIYELGLGIMQSKLKARST